MTSTHVDLVYMFWGKRHYFTVINLVLELFTIQRSNIIWDVPRILCHACFHEKKKFKNSKPIKKEIVNSTKNFKLCESDKKELKDHLQNEKKSRTDFLVLVIQRTKYQQQKA